VVERERGIFDCVSFCPKKKVEKKSGAPSTAFEKGKKREGVRYGRLPPVFAGEGDGSDMCVEGEGGENEPSRIFVGKGGLLMEREKKPNSGSPHPIISKREKKRKLP